MSEGISIVIADDHPLFLEGIRTVVQKDLRIASLIESGEGRQAYTIIQEQQPTIAILDINMPGMSGLEIAEFVQRDAIPTKIVILTMYDEADLFNRAMDLGVMGYILKDSAVTEISSCISSVIENDPFVSPSLSKLLINRSGRATKPEQVYGISLLTESERKILKFVGEGMTTKEISSQLSISPKTVENHRANICEKLNVHGTNALLRFAMENKRLL